MRSNTLTRVSNNPGAVHLDHMAAMVHGMDGNTLRYRGEV